MKDHNDSLQENIAKVSNRYNEVQLLLKTKTQLVRDQTNKSKKQISEWLQKYIDTLTAEKALIDAKIEKEEQVVKVVYFEVLYHHSQCICFRNLLAILRHNYKQLVEVLIFLVSIRF